MKKIVLALLIVNVFRGESAEIFLTPTISNHVVEVMIEKSLHSNDQTVVLLHGAQDAGWRSISAPVFDYWLKKGCAVGAVSMPGYGQSSGIRDFCGPFTIHALHVAIDKIKQELGVSQFILMGFGQGGLAAALLSAERKDILCTICSNAIADLLQHKREGDRLLTTLQQKNYDLDVHDDANLIARSPIYHIASIDTPMFVLHRRNNPVIHEREPIAFYEAMIAAGKECHLVIKERGEGQHEEKLSFQEIIEVCGEWLDQLTKRPRNEFRGLK